MLDTLYKRLTKLVKEEVAKRRAESAQILRHCEPVRAWQSISENSKIIIKEITGWLRCFISHNDGKTGLLRRFTCANGEKLRKKIAFTLAEVLITITIVGVVTILVLPVLNKKIQNTANKVALKNAYSILTQAMQMFKADTNTNIVDTYCNGVLYNENGYKYIKDLSKYFKGKTVYASNTRDLKTLGYNKSTFDTFAKKMNFNPGGNKNGAIVLNNGMIVFSSSCWWSTRFFEFIIDTNGLKGPNRLGYDVFFFRVDSQNNVYPTPGTQIPRTPGYTDDTSDCCNQDNDKKCLNFDDRSDNGVSCTYYALSDKNPTDSSKGYWNSLK